MNLKINVGSFLSDKEKELVSAVNDGLSHHVVLTTNSLSLEMDTRQGGIKQIKNVKMIFNIEKGGCLILFGNLGCSFTQPWGGEFFVRKALLEENSNFKLIKGFEREVLFCNYPIDNTTMKSTMAQISQSTNFVFNLSQFDEFMDIFSFYKKLSEELNNNITYDVISISRPYYFVPVEVKEIECESSSQITNLNGVVIGYILEDYKFELLSSELQDRVKYLIDVKVLGEDKAIKRVNAFRDNLYLSNCKDFIDKYTNNIKSFELINILKDKDNLILSGEIDSIEDYKFLNLFDVGQKVKLESIDNSLRLINQGASGAAAELLEYIIGSKPMPSNYSTRKVNDGKDKYLKDLDESQRRAFLMATDGSPVSLIKGPPGTGKTYVINAIVQYITKELNQKVVISSQTHVAIDNVLDQLMENFDLIIPNRITNRRNKYSGNEIDTTLYKTWAKNFNIHNLRSSDKELANAIEYDMNKFKGRNKFKFSEMSLASEFSVIGATTTTSAIGGKKGLELLDGYDWLIIDEVSKCPITEVLRYLPYVSKIIMVGDDFQLAPLLEFSKEEVEELPSFNENKFDKLKSIYEKSVFANTLKKAGEVGRLVTLCVNYRSLKYILNAYNIFYGFTLVNKRESVKPKIVKFTDKYPVFNEKDIFFVDVKNGKEAKENTSRYNIEELSATASILKDLIENTIKPLSVSVSAIFPYAAQIEKFQQRHLGLINTAKKTFKSFEIDTVDAFQGKETDIVLVNTVVTDSSQRNFLNDFRRINVSMSRARDKVFIFGNPITLSKIEMQVSDGDKRRYFKEIIEDISRYGGMIIYEGGVNYESSSKPKIKVI